MNQSVGQHWSQAEQQQQQYNDMAAISEQDFANFVDLDLGDIDDLSLPIFDGNNHQQSNYVPASEAHHQHDPQRPADAIDHHHHHQSANIFDMNMHMAFDGRQDHSYTLPPGPAPTSQPSMIPPTPNSTELQSEAAARFLAQLDPQTRAHIIEQQYHQLRKAEAQNNFTPLVSPAVTPHDTRFHLPQEYGVQPGVYFSPLTSPALEGQMQPYLNNNTSASSVATSSPVDLNVDLLGDAAVPQQQGRKRQKRPNAPRSSSASVRVGKSPAVKPLNTRRKGPPPPVVASKPVQQVVDHASKANLSPTSPTVAQGAYTQTSSGSSISPEPLSEARMGPPPKPGSAQQSPAMHAQSRSSSSTSLNAQAFPATPSTLLKTREAHHAAMAQPLLSPNGTVMEELSLPEPADSSRPHLAHIDTSAADDCSTPRIPARKTPKLGPLSTPGSASLPAQNGIRSAPVTSAIVSPTSATMSPLIRKQDSRGGRGSKKRSSMSSSSVLVSPAIRPKISPSIRPMLPTTADPNITMDEAMQTHFLTQRSNYQNLIEGTHVPGVSYPSELSTNLTSKRTSHKIAEQGRRNRINLALQEMLSLLPPKNGSPQTLNVKSPMDDDDDDDGKGKGKGGGNSKAATVESAIDYIRTLQTERSIFCQRIEERDKEVEDLRRRLDEMERKFGEKSGSGTPLDPVLETGGESGVS